MLHAFFVRLFLCFSHLLLFLLYPPPFFFPLVGTSSPSESLLPSHPAISSSTGSLRNSWARWRSVVQDEEQRQLVIERQERELATTGRRTAGRPAKTTSSEQEQLLIELHRLLDAVRYLFAQLRDLLEVVVLTGESEPHVLGCQTRRGEVQTVLDLLEEAIQSVPAPLQKEVQRVIKQVRLALPALLYFAEEVEAAQREA